MSPRALPCVLAAASAALAPACAGRTGRGGAPHAGPAARPNVVVIITDDQGYGDLGAHGNPDVRTTHLDRLSREGVSFSRFYVSPVCSPTRASLLTGRYNYRTGVVDTYLGRSLMHPDETTLAESLRAAGYRTGLFGKWHLGDNHPLRATDQGFEEALTLKGGGIGQPSDPPGGDHYLHPTLYRNGRAEKTRGYVTDVLTEAAIEFIRRRRGEPFFAYVAFNAPHTPLEAPEAELASYAARGLPDAVARVYAMVTNIDANVGRLLAVLDELGLVRDTIVVFLTDNGPAGKRYDAGLRGAKGTLYEGGIRVPFLVRWPAGFAGGRTVDRVAAHIDVAPTLLEATGVRPPHAAALDGRSLLPLLRDGATGWPERTLFFQWHRGDAPQRGRAFAARSDRWKLVGPADPTKPGARDELFDMGADPAETTDVSERHAPEAARLRAAYDAWFADVSRTRGFDPPRIRIGTPLEDPVVLTRQDWRGPRAGWTPQSLGHWEIDVATRGAYRVRLLFAARATPATARVRLGPASAEQSVRPEAREATFTIDAPPGPARLEAELAGDAGPPLGVDYVEISTTRPRP
jgi:arylsulfatase A-like enzyme